MEFICFTYGLKKNKGFWPFLILIYPFFLGNIISISILSKNLSPIIIFIKYVLCVPKGLYSFKCVLNDTYSKYLYLIPNMNIFCEWLLWLWFFGIWFWKHWSFPILLYISYLGSGWFSQYKKLSCISVFGENEVTPGN